MLILKKQFIMKNIFLTLLVVMAAVSVNAQEVFRTQTIGGWGSNPSGDNPGAYLAENFDLINGVRALTGVESGISIGLGDKSITFTSAEAIQKFLPSSGTAAALEMSYIDPAKQEVRNTFASQTLALTISLAFDKTIEDYSVSTKYLGDMVVAEGEMTGVKVDRVLEEANKALAGVETTYSIATLNETISKINEAYVDGEIRTAYLTEATTGQTEAIQQEYQQLQTEQLIKF